MNKHIAAVLFGLCLTLLTAATTHADADCRFVLGFKALRDLIPDIVGECLEQEHYNATGDSVQHTIGGLLVWRKADNWTAFTDGYRTWINGPNGLQQRLNTERFEWEPDYASFTAPAPTPAQEAIQPTTGLTLDPTLSHAFHIIRTRWKPTGESIYQIYLGTGASAQFGPLENYTSEWTSSPPTIVVNEEFRNESPEVLAHTLIWPTVELASYIEFGAQDTWEACAIHITGTHKLMAQFWLAQFGENGKQNPTQLEQWANLNLSRFLSDSLDTWVNSAYREQCAQYGEPPPKPTKNWHLDCRSYSLVATLEEVSVSIPVEACVSNIAHSLTIQTGRKPGTAGYNFLKGIIEKTVWEEYYVGLALYASDLYPEFGEPRGLWNYVVRVQNDPAWGRQRALELARALGNDPVLPPGILEMLQAQPTHEDAAALLGAIGYSIFSTLLPADFAATYAPLRAKKIREGYYVSLDRLPDLGYFESPWYRLDSRNKQ